ncbi:MAG TPA: aminoglycoside phosphotransferase family protein [Hypericibacter adhaerens]|uniref:aminoglycoside phosphotransferase family protein n=1 Tax=Hypericibacter adhaerens TaxID=2602016 RepID=UPI002C5C0EB4|nr:aminoglycoside phosphotransferase family protein [Hypericibacter adhaerens]HWA42654.1 aminoglycoside phosphotransferase family protein [Hypericibacter adhaerens]
MPMTPGDEALFAPWLERWDLAADGEPIVTPSSRLLPVRRDGGPAILKIALEAEERRGAELMRWWAGDGAATVLAHEGDALLLERALGPGSLVEMAHGGRDDEATRIIARVAARLHAPRASPPPSLLPLTQWFAALDPVAASQGGLLAEAAAVARELLRNPRETSVLHGDLHHGNVLDFGERGWLAIDPKRLAGERGFDFANILRNPDFALATSPGRLARQATVAAEAAGLERRRLLQWVLAFAGLSAAWHIGDGEAPDPDLAVAEIAAAALAKG